MKNSLFVSKMFKRLLVPSLLASACLAVGNIVDSIVVGAKMGEVGLAAINISMPVYMVFNVFDIGLSLGGSISYSRLLGEGRKDDGVRQFNSILWMSLFLGLLFALLGNLFLEQILFCLGTVPAQGEVYELGSRYIQILLSAAPLFFLDFQFYYYIKNDDNPNLASLGFVAGNVMDIVLNYVLVILFDMGVDGAIFATVIGRITAIVIYIPHFVHKKHILCFKKVHPDLQMIWSSFKIGFATSDQYVFQFAFILLCNNILMKQNGETGVAVFNVVLNTITLSMCMSEAVNNTMQPLVSTFAGERNAADMRQVGGMALRWGLALSSLVFFLVFTHSEHICRMFGMNEGIRAGAAALRIYCIGFPAAIFGSIMTGYFQAAEKERMAFLIVLLRGLVVMLPVTALCALFGKDNFWWLFPITEFVSLLIWGSYCLLRRQEMMRIGNKKEQIYSRTVLSQNEDVAMLVLEAEKFCEEQEASLKQSYFVTMVVEEVCLAIMQHAFVGKAQGYIQITLISDGEGEFELHIRDSAVAFNPFEMKTRKINLEEEDQASLDAMGILMVKTKAKDFFYRSYQGFNTLTIRI